jgi:predicted nucleotidyltransferase
LARRLPGAVSPARHYLHLGERQRRTYFADTDEIPLKKIFYALRPAVALRWLRLNPGAAVAPMHFPSLIAASDLPADVLAIVDDLLARKAVTSEIGAGPLPAPIGRLVDEEFALARDLWLDEAWRPDAETLAAADAFFRRWVTG